MRVDVPANWIVRASFWQGACDSEPSGGSPLHPVWFGRVVNISAGGMLLAAEEAVSRALEPGDTVGMRLSFVSSGESLYTDAQFRHLEADKGRVLLGFQFLGLTETPEGRVVLQMISAKVSEYQRIALQNATFKEN
jgi:c-di-GMP-binding flagellar brake protein YcgR